MDSFRIRTNGYNRLDRYSTGTPIEDAQQSINHKHHDDDFDDLYDITEDEAEAEDIPIQISMSPNTQRGKDRSYPALVIPSPTAWPTIDKFRAQAGHLSPVMLSPPAIVSPKPGKLSQLAVPRPTTSNAPSLDGSLTSEDLSNVSCPSTPDNYGRQESEDIPWAAPMQLHPQSLHTLLSLSRSEEGPEPEVGRTLEMQEAPRPVRMPRLDSCIPATFDCEELSATFESEELSMLSIPPPGGLFSSSSGSRHDSFMQPEIPSTSTAEYFYGIPFEHGSQEEIPPVPELPHGFSHYGERIIESVIEYACDTDGPSTARQAPDSARTVTYETYIADQQEYNEEYERKMRESSTMNLDRTASWLRRQETLEGNDEADATTEQPESPVQGYMTLSLAPIEEEIDAMLEMPELKESKSVRFSADSADSATTATTADVAPAVPPKDNIVQEPVNKDSTFVRGFEYLKQSSGSNDAFVHRKTRTEKLRLDRKCLVSSHVNQLSGKFELNSNAGTSNLTLTVSESISEEDAEKKEVQEALRERDALEQMKAVSWNLEATKLLNGGSLLTSPTGKFFSDLPDARVLDLGGQVSCDWAWQVAIEYPMSTVYTAHTSEQEIDNSIQGPLNHKTSKVSNLWSLPFPDNYFDLVSARHLYSQLKLEKPKGRSRDEYDLCLRECLRVLRPGGHLEFAVMDADLLDCGRQTQAMSVEFAFNLRNKGYDPAATKTWLRRVRRAGFDSIHRAWLILPMSKHGATMENFQLEKGTTTDASYISGVVGGWSWERWMLKLQKEMGKDGDKLLEGVAAAFEEGAKTGTSWRYLSGWATKPY